MARPLVFVHGFRYDPKKLYLRGRPGPDHPEYHTYPKWRAMLSRDENINPFVWFSNPGIWDAWRHRRWNRYRYAWDLAATAADQLWRHLLTQGEGSDIVCHSLGSRVTMLALAVCPVAAHRVLILNGAEYSRTGKLTAQACPKTRFYNVVVRQDDVLNKLARFAPGWGDDFLGNHGPPSAHNWQNFALDRSPLLRRWTEEHGLPPLAGDNPESMGDHLYSFENEANWPLYRAIFSGEWDAWLAHKRINSTRK